MKDPLGDSPSKGNQGTTRGKEKVILAVLFCFVLSGRPNHAKFWKVKTPVLQVKFFKQPVVRDTISIIQKMFIPTGAKLVHQSQPTSSRHVNCNAERK